MSSKPSLFSSNGRIGRETFWDIVIVLNIINLFVFFLIKPVFTSTLDILSVIILGSILIPSLWIGLVTQIKRWHDLSKSGWWILITLIPVIGAFWIIIELGCIRGTIGPNQYGPDPLVSN